MLNLKNKRCVIVGGGRVAYRKALDLIECGALLTIISPTLDDNFAQHSQVHWIGEKYNAGFLKNFQPFLVIAATDDASVNQAVLSEAHSAGILASVVDQSAESDFTGMSYFRRGRITAAVATEGASPALAKLMREEIEAVIVPGYDLLADQLAAWRIELRDRVQASDVRAEIWRRLLAHKTALIDLIQRENGSAEALFESVINEVLQEKE